MIHKESVSLPILMVLAVISESIPSQKSYFPRTQTQSKVLPYTNQTLQRLLAIHSHHRTSCTPTARPSFSPPSPSHSAKQTSTSAPAPNKPHFPTVSAAPSSPSPTSRPSVSHFACKYTNTWKTHTFDRESQTTTVEDTVCGAGTITLVGLGGGVWNIFDSKGIIDHGHYVTGYVVVDGLL